MSRAGAPRSGQTRAGQPRTGPQRSGGAGPSRSGPGKARPALAARARTRPPEPPSPSTAWVRAAILLGIVVMLAVTIVPTLRSLIQQRNDTTALADTVTAQKRDVAELQKQALQWKDPAFIEAQARERLKFVRIGDRAYTVLDAGRPVDDTSAASRTAVAAPMANDSSPWYGKLWQSIQIADRPTAGLR